MLIARNLEKLNATAKELQAIGTSQNKQVKTRVITLDLSAPENLKAKVYERIYKEKLGDIDISVLINNAGYAQVGYFDEISEQDVHTQLTCNTYPVILLTQQLLKSFKSRYTKFGKRSLLATTSSIAGHYPIPLLGVYSASKKFVDSFS